MIKKIFLIILLLLLTGCYDYKELNQISIIGATSIDKKVDEYIVKIQVINPQNVKESTADTTSFIIYESKGKSLQESYRKITNSSPRFTYSDHMQILFLSKDIVKENFSEALDFYLRNPSVRSDFYILIEKSNDIIELITPINQISATSIKDSIENNSNNYGTITKIDFNELSKMYLNPNKEIVLPTIELIGNINEGNEIDNTTKTNDYTKYKLDNLAIFKDKKFLTYLDDDESLAYNFITNNINTAIISYECDINKNIVTNILNSKTDIKVNKNNININVDTHGNLIEVGCNLKMNNNDIKEIENNISNKIKEILTKSIYKVQNIYNSDIYGFKDLYYKNDYKYYKKIKDNYYNNIFKNINIKVSVKTHISKEGTILEVYNEKD